MGMIGHGGQCWSRAVLFRFILLSLVNGCISAAAQRISINFPSTLRAWSEGRLGTHSRPLHATKFIATSHSYRLPKDSLVGVPSTSVDRDQRQRHNENNDNIDFHRPFLSIGQDPSFPKQQEQPKQTRETSPTSHLPVLTPSELSPSLAALIKRRLTAMAEERRAFELKMKAEKPLRFGIGK